MKGKEQFKVLLAQAGIQDNDHLSGGRLEKIVADDDERVWEFHIHFDRMIPASLRNLMEGSIREAFHSIAEAKIFITADSYDDKDIIDYLEYALAEVKVNDNIRFQLMNCDKEFKDGLLTFSVQNDIEVAHFNKHINGNLTSVYKSLGLPITAIDFRADANLDSDKRTKLEARLKEEKTELVQGFIENRKEMEEERESRKEEVVKQIGKSMDLNGVRPLHEVVDEEFNVKVEGVIFDSEVRELRTGRKILQLKITDYTDSIAAKMFSRHGKNDEDVFDALSKNDWVVIEGNVEYDEFARDMVLMIRNLNVIHKPAKKDTMEDKRVELHLHTEMSQMDALRNIGDYVQRAKDYGHKAIAITDHSNVQAFPDAFHAAQAAGIKMIYGMEGMLVDDGAPIA